ncbi:MAG: hypothetical protein PUK40_06395 [Actinomycetaceae bacterium]|nr:hypothetical protein [Arcanobacterium sp.]MDD7505552.1 hypothetical protein [Actinomycetaceae bacterium]
MVEKKTTTGKKPAGKKTATVPAPDTDQAPQVTRDITVRGINIHVDFADLDDVDVLYKLRDANNGDMFASLDLIDLMIGVEQRAALVNTIRDSKTGRASVGDLAGLLEELLEAFPK